MHTQAIGIPGKHIQLRALSQEDLPLLLSWENDPEGWYSSGTINPLSSTSSSATSRPRPRISSETGSMSLIIEGLKTRSALGHLILYDYSPIHRRLGVGILYRPVRLARRG